MEEREKAKRAIWEEPSKKKKKSSLFFQNIPVKGNINHTLDDELIKRLHGK